MQCMCRNTTRQCILSIKETQLTIDTLVVVQTQKIRCVPNKIIGQCNVELKTTAKIEEKLEKFSEVEFKELRIEK